MDNIAVRRHGMRRAQQRVNESLQMLGADRRQPPYPHAVVRLHGRSEITAAINRNFVSQAHKFVASLLVIGFDAAIFRDHAAPADKRDTDPRPGPLR